MSRRALALVLLAGCYDDYYQCTTNEDCGTTGRCEADRRCTITDVDCPSSRRYTEHNGDASNVCYTDNADPLNVCASGQAPARGDNSCTAAVCDAIAACCESGWFDACVQEAQIRCDVACTTSIAVTARGTVQGGGVVESVFDLTWDGSIWTQSEIVSPDIRSALSSAFWLAPALREIEPRLATLITEMGVGSTLAITGTPTITLSARTYGTVTSVDFDRDGRDQIALSSFVTLPDLTSEYHFELLDLVSGGLREQVGVDFYGRLAWGDWNHDEFPDAASGNANTYRIIENRKNAGGRGGYSDLNTTSQAPGVRSIEWSSLARSGQLDLIVASGLFNYHIAPRDQATYVNLDKPTSLDCTPPGAAPMGGCALGTNTGWSGAARPRVDGASFVMASNNRPGLWVVDVESTGAAGMAVALPSLGCAVEPCVKAHAVATRDLDGDHLLDIIAVDSLLNVWVTSSASPDRLVKAFTITPSTTMPETTTIVISVTGRPRT